ncbi:MAG: transglutaminaseTgpA domain-containing protein, partial [Rhodoglobus sp.]
MSVAEQARAASITRHHQRVQLWSLAGMLALAIGVAASSLSAVLTQGAWWFDIMAVVIVLLATATTVRMLGGRAIWGTAFGLIAVFVQFVARFALDTTIVGILPTGDTVARFGELVREGNESIASQRFPADADTGIVFLLCVAGVAVAVACDLAAFVLRRPALTGIALLILLLAPSFVSGQLYDAFGFALSAIAYGAVLLVASPPAAARSAWGLLSAALIISLIVPVVLPGVVSRPEPGDRLGLIGTGVNPIITLSRDLRRGSPLQALRYTAAGGGEYLRVAVLDNFGDDTWSPSSAADDSSDPSAAETGESVEALSLPAGLTETVPRSTSSLQVEIGRLRGTYAPVPYAATSVTGLRGNWRAEPDSLTVSTESANIKNQQYEVSYLTPAPTIEQLEAAPTVLPSGYEKYLALPETLPALVADTAVAVAGSEPNRFEQALALQSFFRDGDFVYSEQAPIDADYDGSGAAVLAQFLTAKSGYCVHFASAMAAMARTLDIPARVVVGFTPGEKKTDDETDTVNFVVSTDNLHAWPELYFADIGWIRFEPTVSVGTEPRFAQSVDDDPSTPGIDESKPLPVATNTTTPTAVPPQRQERPLDEQSPSSTTPGSLVPLLWLLLAVPLLLIPAAVRALRRELRLRAVARGATAVAWREICDTARDLGCAVSATATPRQQYNQLSHT